MRQPALYQQADPRFNYKTIRGELGARAYQRDIPHIVYQHVHADGKRLYIGCTHNMLQRHKTHRTYSPWWSFIDHMVIDALPDKRSAIDAEAHLIRMHAPVWNKRHQACPYCGKTLHNITEPCSGCGYCIWHPRKDT